MSPTATPIEAQSSLPHEQTDSYDLATGDTPLATPRSGDTPADTVPPPPDPGDGLPSLGRGDILEAEVLDLFPGETEVEDDGRPWQTVIAEPYGLLQVRKTYVLANGSADADDNRRNVTAESA